MTRSGLPDYGMYAALENMGNLVDYGELAARLSSLSSFNREGNIVFWDDFESTPLKWLKSVGQPGSSVAYSNEEALSGGQSVKLITGTSLGYEVGIRRDFPRFASGKQGMEIAFSNESKNYMLYIEAFVRNITHYHRIRIRIHFEDDLIQLWDENSTWHTIATDICLLDTVNLFHHLKIVIDTENNNYVRIMVDRNEYNVEEYGMLISEGATDESFEIKCFIRNYAAIVCKAYLDSFILTQNEP